MSKGPRRFKKMPAGVPPAGAGQPDSLPDDSASPRGLFEGNSRAIDFAICLGLLLATLFVYAQVHGFDFVAFDDPQYIQANPHVQAGLTLDGIKWAFTSPLVGNWTPVTVLSLMLDVQLFGSQSGMSHLVNVIFHALAGIFLFLALQRATRARGLSAIVAFVFAVHPLHVESVAWIAERKDVLSAFFGFFALYTYVSYSEQPGALRYLAVAALFALGLMSKPMLVTFPCVLLLFDVWPLRRPLSLKLLWEKLPLLALSVGASAVTYLIQGSTGALRAIPFATTLENAALSYVVYIGQTFWPARLAFYYPYPSSFPLWQVGAAVVFVLAISALALRDWRKRPYLAVGWFWYVGTLVPVIGLVQAGGQAHADRYMYIPMVGLLIALVWGAAELVEKWRVARIPLVAAAVVVCAAYMIVARADAEYWHDSETLSRRALEVTQGNAVAENTLGTYLVNLQRTTDAIPHFENAVRIDKDFDLAHFNLGAALSRMPDRAADAIAEYQAALRINPHNPEAHNNLAVVLSNRGDRAAAIAEFQAAIRDQPDYASARFNLASLLTADGNFAAAIEQLEAAIRERPDFVNAHRSLADTLAKVPGRTPDRIRDAIKEYDIVLKANPDDGSAHSQLGELLASLGRNAEAIPHLEAGLRANPDPAVAKTLDRLLAEQKR